MKTDMQHYLDMLLSQIRDKRARELVRCEIESHLEDQKQAYLAEGMPEPKAEKAAVADMGDPVETGAALDQIHRPKPAWKMLAVAAVLCIAGVLFQYGISLYGSNGSSYGSYFFQRQCFHAVFGFLLLCGIYLLDYTRIAVCSIWLCRLILLFLIITVNQNPFPLSIPMESVLYLYVPLFGSVLYAHRTSPHQPWLILLYTILPLVLALKYGRLTLFLNLTVIFLVMLGTAAAKGWFLLPRNILLPSALAVLVCCPHLAARMLRSYQFFRIRAWLNPDFDTSGINYISSQIHTILNGSQFVGPSMQHPMDGILPNVSTDFILTFVIGCYGVLAATALILLVVLFALRLLHISIHQKNQLGMIMGLGCSLVFGIQSAEYILINLGLLPVAGTYFPLISYGGNGMVHTCILLGILLSIYRYQDVVSDPIF